MAHKPKSFRPSNMPAPQERERLYDRDRNRQPWRRWYFTSRWKAIAKHQLAIEPLCRMCAAKGIVTAATTCDHTERHGGDHDRFWNGPFQSLCTPCHSSDKQRLERGRRGGIESSGP